ncbi:RNA-binding protein 4B-like [Pristis pectinata]|uniref:RNA-binding protein 4B-like n=1 Tax=Pristis pectinata TaxID=685728 RepID=UPI00223E8533|nr:RNA-binding protein 4B-like [Pristis pectinata]
MVKIFVGNLSRCCGADELRAMFEKYGEVSECEVVRRYAFVHMERLSQATRAIRALHRADVRGARLTVGVANARTRSTTKVFVGNLAESVTGADVKRLFGGFGRVVDLDVARTFAFVYMEQERQALAAIQALDGAPLQGQNMFVQLSRSNPARGAERPPRRPGPEPGPGPPPPFAYYDRPGYEPYRRSRPLPPLPPPPLLMYQDRRPPGVRPMPPQYFRGPSLNGYGARVRDY